jgi:SagB-type dehydrogenase family enzyme
MPHPFRYYEGALALELPPDPPAPEIPALAVLQRQIAAASDCAGGAQFLSRLLFHSAAISATKRVPSTGHQYSLRVNPSSGNLHPTEFHFITRGLKDWPDGLYHYLPSSHTVEQRAAGNFATSPERRSVPIQFLLTSIAWREAWKYRTRAYRYCLHDMGHAWQAVALAARALGCESFAMGHFPDDEVAQFCRLNEDEWPMLLVGLRGRTIPMREPETSPIQWYEGRANRLSPEQVAYPAIDRMHAVTRLATGSGGIGQAEPAQAGSGSIPLPKPAHSTAGFGHVVRTRRSALDFQGGSRSLSLAQLSALLNAAAQPLFADFAAARFVDLYLYVHRVEGLEPGVYRHWPEHGGSLEPMLAGDQRVAAAGLSLGQDLAGNACVAFSMIADLERAARAHGDRGYRYAHFEAGAIGQHLYLAAEALGLGATGIGAFFDDEVNGYLKLAPGAGQVIYHFAIGYPVPDPRVGF